MVDLAEIQAIYYMVAATGVLIAAAYYVMTLKSTMDNRKAQLLMECNRIMNSKEYLIDLHESLNYEWKDFDDFWAKYGHPNPEAHSRWISIANSMSNTLDLLKLSLINEEMARKYLGYVSMGSFWEKFAPAVKEMRVRMNLPDMFENIEFYYDKWKLSQSHVRAVDP
jgi:hypothetical protein